MRDSTTPDLVPEGLGFLAPEEPEAFDQAVAQSEQVADFDLPFFAAMLATVGALQKSYAHAQHPKKLAAKARAIELLSAKVRRGGAVLDLGGEAFYQEPLVARYALTSWNLPDDMHALPHVAAFDGALAMHVLEHSPVPLYVLLLLHRALRPGGWLYVAVPEPCDKFCTRYGHVSVLPPAMWRRLFEVAGFRLGHTERGAFGRRKQWIEHRFLLERA